MSARILLVEDDLDIREALADAFTDEGYSFAGVANGQEALDYLRSHGEKPSLILLDLMMPTMNGAEFREAQLKDPTLADIPVLLMSADANIAQRAAELGVQLHLCKPVRLGELFEVIERYR